MFSVIRNFIPIEILEKEYDATIYYNYTVHLAISRGQYEVVLKFLEKVPSLQKKGKVYLIKILNDF